MRVRACACVTFFFHVCYTDFSVETVAQKIEEDSKNTFQNLNDSQTDLVHERQMNSTLQTQVIFSLTNEPPTFHDEQLDEKVVFEKERKDEVGN